MGNKITVISDVSRGHDIDVTTYSYRIGVDGEYITGRGRFHSTEKDLTRLELWAQKVALNHLMSWFTIPQGTNIDMFTDSKNGIGWVVAQKGDGKHLHNLMEKIRIENRCHIRIHYIEEGKIRAEHNRCHSNAIGLLRKIRKAPLKPLSE